MRWGVRDEATDDHLTTNISLEELENCKNVSVGPSFFFLIGQKYGYRPLPTTVPGEQFECLLQVVWSLLIGRDPFRYYALIGWNPYAIKTQTPRENHSVCRVSSLYTWMRV